MEWYISLPVVMVFGVAALLIQRTAYRQGVEVGSHAAFSIESELVGTRLLEKDQSRLRRIFQGADRRKPEEIRRAALEAGKAYRGILRRTAIEDCQYDDFDDIDRYEWKQIHGGAIPPISYNAGYLQAVKDVITGAAETATKYFEKDGVDKLSERLDQSQRTFSGPPAYMYLGYSPDGKTLGEELISQTVVHTFKIAEKKQP